jgi:hypothetical protein
MSVGEGKTAQGIIQSSICHTFLPRERGQKRHCASELLSSTLDPLWAFCEGIAGTRTRGQSVDVNVRFELLLPHATLLFSRDPSSMMTCLVMDDFTGCGRASLHALNSFRLPHICSPGV